MNNSKEEEVKEEEVRMRRRKENEEEEVKMIKIPTEKSMVQNSLILGHQFIHFPTSLRVTERTNECSGRASKTSTVEQVKE